MKSGSSDVRFCVQFSENNVLYQFRVVNLERVHDPCDNQNGPRGRHAVTLVVIE
jgi:hypothetical protein